MKVEFKNIVKIIYDEDGEKVENPKWCLVISPDGANRTFCKGEVFGFGEGSAVYEDKIGRVTCPKCIKEIKLIKSVKL